MATQSETRKAETDLNKEIAKLQAELADMRDQLKSAVKAGGNAVKENAEGALDSAKELTAAARDKLVEEAEALLSKLREGAAGTVDTIKETGKKALGGVESTIEERPVTSVLTALGIGFAIGWLVTKSR